MEHMDIFISSLEEREDEFLSLVSLRGCGGVPLLTFFLGRR